MCCKRLLSTGSVTFRNEPISPRCIVSSTLLRPVPGPVGVPYEYWFNWPTFSSSVICLRSASTFPSISGAFVQDFCVCAETNDVNTIDHNSTTTSAIRILLMHVSLSDGNWMKLFGANVNDQRGDVHT